MKKLLLMAVLLSLTSFALANTVTIDFEQYAEFTQITNQYSALGATFTNALQLVEPDYNYFDFPPHSGLGVVTNDPNDPMQVNFSVDVRTVSGWYAAPDGIVADAFDSHGNLLTSFIGVGVDGSNLQFTLSSPATPIAWITISANDGADAETVDDLSFAITTTPEPGSLVLMGSGMLGLAGILRRKLAR